MAKSYVDALAAKYYGQLTSGRRAMRQQSAPSAPSVNAHDFITGGRKGLGMGDGGQTSSGGSGGGPSGVESLPDNLQNPDNPYDWFLQKTLAGTNPWSKAVMAMSDPDKGVGKVIDVISQPMYANVQQSADVAGSLMGGDYGKALSKAVNPLQYYGSGNNKRTISDAARGDSQLINTVAEESGTPVRTEGDTGFLASQEDEDWKSRAAKGVAGFALDVGGDPVSYVPGAAIAKVASAPAKLGAKAIRATAKEGNFSSKLLDAGAKAKDTRLGQDIQLFNKRLKGTRTAVPSETARARNIEALPEEIRPEPIAVQQVIPEQVIPEQAIPETTPVGTDVVPTGRVTQDVTESGPRLIPESSPETPAPTLADSLSEAWVPSGKKTRLMRNAETGEVRPYDAKVMRGEATPKYPGMEITDLWKPIKQSEKQKAQLALAKEQQKALTKMEKLAPSLSDKQAALLSEAEAATRPGISRADFNKSWYADLKSQYDAWDKTTDNPDMLSIDADLPTGPVNMSVYEWIDVLRKAKGKSLDPALKSELSDVARVIDEMQGEAFAARTAAEPKAKRKPGAQVAQDGARQARERADALVARLSRSTSRRRLTGAPLMSWSRKYASALEPDEVIGLLSAKNYKEFAQRKSGIQRKVKRQPTAWADYYIDVLEAPKVADDVPTTNVFEDAKKGLDTADEIVETAPRKLDPEQERVIEEIRSGNGLDEYTLRALQESTNEQLWREVTPQGEYRFETARGTRRNEETLGAGRGVNRNGWNNKAQMNFFASLTMSLSKEATEKGLKGFQRARWMKSQMLPRLRAGEDFMSLNSVPGTAGSGQTGMPLHLSQIFEAMSLSQSGRSLLEARVFTGFSMSKNAKGLVDVDSLLKIGNIIADTVGETIRAGDDVDAAIRTAVKEWLSKGDRTRIKKALEGETTFRSNDGTTVTNIREIGNGKMIELDSGQKVYDRRPVSKSDSAKVVDEVVAVFEDPATVHAVLQFVHDNTAAASIQFGRNVGDITEETVRSVLNILDDVTGNVSFSDKAKAISDPKAVAKRVKASYKRGVTNAEVDAAATKATADLTEVIPEIDVRNADTATSISRAANDTPATVMPATKTNVKTQEKYDANVESALRETPAEALNPDDLADLAMQTGLFKMLDPLARTFVAHYGNATMHEAMTKSGSLGGVYDRIYRHDLTKAEHMARELAKKAGSDSKTVWKQAWNGIRRGDEIRAFPKEMQEFATEVRKLIEPFFAADRNGKPQSIVSMFQREGFDIDHINFKMGNPRFKLPEDIRFTKPNTAKGAKPETVAAYSQQWRGWEIEDPMDFMAKIQSIATELATETAISREFYRLGSNKGMVSTKPRSGFVKVERGKDMISRYLPVGDNGNVYMHPDAYREMERMSSLLERANGKPDAAFNNFIRNNLDPILSMWKSGMTIWRPGHHVRTLIGDLGMAYLVSGLKDPRYYARSLKMVTQRQNKQTFRGRYGQWDAQAALQGLGQQVDAAAFKQGNVGLADTLRQMGGVSGHFTGPAAKVRLGNKVVDLDSETIHKQLMDRGVLPDFRRQEDIIDAEGSTGLVKSLTEKAAITGGRARTKLGNFTEGRDDFVRIAHALHLLEAKKYKSMDEAFDSVAATLRKAHPDGTDLTPFERNVMRRIFPFYSWTRKAIPLVIENMLRQPGRFTAYPKAMYNYAESMGVDLESLSEPFPEDQLFPRFMTEKMTGITNKGMPWNPDSYYSFDLGIPQADVLNEFAAGGPEGSLGGVAGMLNPALKAPIELRTKTNLATGAPISDTSDYIDGQIPGINAIASITGTSPTGTIAGMLSGSGKIDEQYQRGRGNRGGLSENPEYLINYLTGMRLTDASKPNYQRLAQIQTMQEQKDRADFLNEAGWGS